MADLNKDFDLAEHQVVDILGNLGEECNGFTAMQEEKPLVPGSRGGYGWAQWTGSRRVKFEVFVAIKGSALGLTKRIMAS
jgi:Phage tail lysozyme